MPATHPLSGLRVIECGGWNTVLAGRLLADAGADVVRVIPPVGDPMAAEPPFFGDSRVSIQDAWYNARKRVVTLDLASSERQQAFLDLISGADILIDDWLPGAAPVTDDAIRQANQVLARVSVTPMGPEGPWAGLAVNDLVANALCGSASVTGNAETPPISGYGNQSHHTVGFYVAICALAAHRGAKATGAFQHVDLSAHEALVSCTEQVLMQWFFPDGTWGTPIARRQGSLHWSGAYEVYPGNDGHDIMVTASLNFAQVVLPWLKETNDAEDLADPEKYPNVVAMIRNLPYVMQVMRDWVAKQNAEELFFEAQRRHQPFGVVWSVKEALEKSEQIPTRGYLSPVEVPGFGEVQFPGPFFRTNAGEPPARLPGVVSADAVSWPPRARRTGPGDAKPSRPLAGIRIMDFTHVLAGPFGTRVLGDLGADVIKVGAASRAGGANSPDHPYYTCWNRNKRSLSLNMATEEGKAVARRLASKCDVIIENFSAGVLARWGLDRASMAAANPGLSVISMGGMGQTGPWRSFVTYAPTIHALTGLTHLTNPPGRHDLGYGFSLTDHLSGLAGALAAIEAVEHRERTGHGIEVDLSQYELGLGIMGPALIDHLANGANPEPRGNRHPFDAWAPHGIYRCAGDDRWVAIAVRGDDQWRALCRAMGSPRLATDPRFATHAARIANQDALDAEVERWTAGMDRYAVMEACQREGVPAGAVQNAEDLTGRDPQVAAANFFGTTTTTTKWQEYGFERFPARFNGQRPSVYEGVHDLGADTFDVLTGLLGMSDDEVAELMAAGALT